MIPAEALSSQLRAGIDFAVDADKLTEALRACETTLRDAGAEPFTALAMHDAVHICWTGAQLLVWTYQGNHAHPAVDASPVTKYAALDALHTQMDMRARGVW